MADDAQHPVHLGSSGARRAAEQQPWHAVESSDRVLLLGDGLFVQVVRLVDNDEASVWLELLDSPEVLVLAL